MTSNPPPPGRLLAVVPTSGSSGVPKGVGLSYGAFDASARASAARLGWRDDDRWLLSLPIAHVGGLSILTRCLAARRTVVLPPPGEGFDAATAYARLVDSRITHLSVVPTMLRRLLDLGAAPPAALRRLLVGGAPLPPAWLEEARAAGWPALATYGLTEGCSQVATQPPSDLEEAEPRAGAPLLDGFEAEIDDDGVLSLRGPALFSGYLPPGGSRGEDGREDDGRGDDGWLRTGDLARLDGDRLHILGRHDQMIVTGGENVHPAEVERALLELPAVVSAAVVGVADPRWGQTVAAAVVLEKSERTDAEKDAAAPTFDPATAHAALRERLAGFKRPRRWRVLEALPTTPSGKVDRRAVARLFEDSIQFPAACD